MKLGEFLGKSVKITFTNGETMSGLAEYYSSRLDNIDGVASICVGDYELYENEIASIEIIEATIPLAQAV